MQFLFDDSICSNVSFDSGSNFDLDFAFNAFDEADRKYTENPTFETYLRRQDLMIGVSKLLLRSEDQM